MNFSLTSSALTRRGFLGQSGRTASAATLASMGLMGVATQAQAGAVSDYKALVCLFMLGGNDGANTVIPLDTARYNAYTRIRGAGGLALTGNQLTRGRSTVLKAASSAVNQPFAFHTAMAEIDALYGQGKVAVMLNIGSLRKPLTKTEYLTGKTVPGELFSHPDQQIQANAGLGAGATTGWGGRLVDALGVARALDAVCVGTNGQFVQGATLSGNLVPESGGFGLNGMNFWPQTEADQRMNALKKVLATSTGNRVSDAANKALADGISLSNTLKSATSTAVTAVFPATSLGNQLKVTAQLIAAASKQGPGRQVYYVSLGGFDTHGGQAWQQAYLLGQVSAAVSAFEAAMSGQGLDKQVTLFTASEFGRTLGPNAGGTDHGWGSVALAVGGAVQGGLYGEFPDYTLGGVDDATGRGVWIPRLGLQQLGATLGRWFGVDAATLSNQVFPNELSQFAVKDLGFMG